MRSSGVLIIIIGLGLLWMLSNKKYSDRLMTAWNVLTGKTG